MLNEYFDKNGEQIKEGMVIIHLPSGDTEKVYLNGDENDLGISASEWEIYPLHQFNLEEWEIVK